MRLTIVGSNGAVPRAGGASNGYLVEDGGTRLLLDCGSGAYSQLQRYLDPFALDGVFISHMHADHFFDLIPFRYALTYALAGRRERLLPLWVPEGGASVLSALAQALSSPPDFFREVFALREYAADEVIQVGSLRVSFARMRHYVPSFGMRLTGSADLAYSADTAMCDEVVEVAMGADLFLCEATAQERTYGQTKGGHLSAADAGRIAARAGARRLVLSHIWHELDPQVSIAEARTTFPGPLSLAREGEVYEVDPIPVDRRGIT